MMNVLQVQDDLKNFSQDQLISEMQQPSGNAPQFLVLSELNRRKRVKGDLEARQASTQQTVAQDAVASAGVPQQGMMGMSEAMAPQSAESGGIGAMMPQTMKNGGVIRAADGLNEETRGYKDRMSDGDFFDYIKPVEYEEDDTRFGRITKGADQILDSAGNLIPYLGNRAIGIGESISDFFTNPIGPDEKQTKINEKDVVEENKAAIGDGNKKVETKPKLIPTSTDEEKPLTIEQELLKRQADLEKNKNSDKWMALAQAGLAIMGSNNPNLAGAIGEGGTAGLTAFGDSNKRYQEGLTDILNARAKMETARLSAVSKGRLTRSSAIQAINTYNTAISSKEKLIQDLMKDNYGNVTPDVQAQINAIKDSIADLTYQQSQLFGAGKIRPRPSVNVGKLPSKQKA